MSRLTYKLDFRYVIMNILFVTVCQLQNCIYIVSIYLIQSEYVTFYMIL